jgi:uncharacterized membrane protein YsdA (DUF1294 family)
VKRGGDVPSSQPSSKEVKEKGRAKTKYCIFVCRGMVVAEKMDKGCSDMTLTMIAAVIAALLGGAFGWLLTQQTFTRKNGRWSMTMSWRRTSWRQPKTAA